MATKNTVGERRSEMAEIILFMKEREGYIKGYGAQDRVMSGDHSPFKNITKLMTQELLGNGLIYLDGMIYRLTEDGKGFHDPAKIKLNHQL